MFGNHGLCGLLEEGAHEKSPKCLGGNLGDFGEFCKGLSLMKEWDILKRRCPEAKLVCLDIQPYTKAQARNRHDILNIGGFSDQVFSLIGSFAERGMGTDFWVEEIEKTLLAVVN